MGRPDAARRGQRYDARGVADAVPTAVKRESELLIFVPPAAHSHDLSLSFVADDRAISADTDAPGWPAAPPRSWPGCVQT